MLICAMSIILNVMAVTLWLSGVLRSCFSGDEELQLVTGVPLPAPRRVIDAICCGDRQALARFVRADDNRVGADERVEISCALTGYDFFLTSGGVCMFDSVPKEGISEVAFPLLASGDSLTQLVLLCIHISPNEKRSLLTEFLGIS